MQDPGTFLKLHEIAPRCAVYPRRAALLDTEHRDVVNHEIFFFSETAALKRFRRDRIRYCGTLTDPVSRVRFTPNRRSPSLDYDGRRFYFASDSTRATFVAMPDSFAVRRGM